MKPRHLAAYAVLLYLLTACAALGLRSDTFNTTLQNGYTGITAAANTAATLRRAGKLSGEDVENIVVTLESLKAGLDVTRQLHATDPDAAADRLSAVIASLTALEAYLVTRSST